MYTEPRQREEFGYCHKSTHSHTIACILRGQNCVLSMCFGLAACVCVALWRIACISRAIQWCMRIYKRQGWKYTLASIFMELGRLLTGFSKSYLLLLAYSDGFSVWVYKIHAQHFNQACKWQNLTIFSILEKVMGFSFRSDFHIFVLDRSFSRVMRNI